jgi:hypothetical protein
MNREEITSKLQIKNIDGLKFGNNKAYCMPKGYALYHPQLGFIGLGNKNEEFNIDLPYTPCGGRKALKSIIDEGGLLTYDSNEVTWIKSLN